MWIRKSHSQWCRSGAEVQGLAQGLQRNLKRYGEKRPRYLVKNTVTRKLKNIPVGKPKHAPSPRIKMNNTIGKSPWGGAPLLLSVVASTTTTSTAVAKNSEKKHARSDMWSAYGKSMRKFPKPMYWETCRIRSIHGSSLHGPNMAPSFIYIDKVDIVSINESCPGEATQDLCQDVSCTISSC